MSAVSAGLTKQQSYGNTRSEMAVRLNIRPSKSVKATCHQPITLPLVTAEFQLDRLEQMMSGLGLQIGSVFERDLPTNISTGYFPCPQDIMLAMDAHYSEVCHNLSFSSSSVASDSFCKVNQIRMDEKNVSSWMRIATQMLRPKTVPVYKMGCILVSFRFGHSEQAYSTISRLARRYLFERDLIPGGLVEWLTQGTMFSGGLSEAKIVLPGNKIKLGPCCHVPYITDGILGDEDEDALSPDNVFFALV